MSALTGPPRSHSAMSYVSDRGLNSFLWRIAPMAPDYLQGDHRMDVLKNLYLLLSSPRHIPGCCMNNILISQARPAGRNPVIRAPPDSAAGIRFTGRQTGQDGDGLIDSLHRKIRNGRLRRSHPSRRSIRCFTLAAGITPLVTG